MTVEERRAFDDILAVFSSPGWRHLEKQIKLRIESTQDVRGVTDLQFAKGALSVLDELANWPTVWASLYEEAESGDVEIAGAFD